VKLGLEASKALKERGVTQTFVQEHPLGSKTWWFVGTEILTALKQFSTVKGVQKVVVPMIETANVEAQDVLASPDLIRSLYYELQVAMKAEA
jgi:hypothetical protein